MNQNKKTTIEIKDGANVDRTNLFNPESYPSSGLFNVDGWLYLINKNTGIAISIEEIDNFIGLAGTQPEEESIKFDPIIQEGTVSESFVLKLLAINAGKVNNVELNGQSFNLAE